MSRIGVQPVTIPTGVKVEINNGQVKVKGPKGELTREFPPVVSVKMDGDSLVVEKLEESKWAASMYGTTRSLVSNMVTGVSDGWRKRLEIHGVGYRAELQGAKLVMSLGFSHPIEMEPPDGITFEVDPKAGTIDVIGADKETVGQVASEIRAWRPPEPYKGKGVRYQGEYVRRKAGKAGKAA